MRVLLLDRDGPRREIIEKILKELECSVKSLSVLEGSNLDELANQDLYILHGSENQGSSDLDWAINRLSEKPALAYTGGFLLQKVNAQCFDQNSKWCNWKGAITGATCASVDNFRSSAEGVFLQQYISVLQESGALEAKRKMNGFDVYLEMQLEDLYQMLNKSEPLESIIIKRDQFFGCVTV